MDNGEYRKQAIEYLQEYGFTKEELTLLYDDTIKLSDEQVKQFVRFLIDGIGSEAVSFILTGDYSDIQAEELRRGFQAGFPLQIAKNQIDNETKAINIRRMVNLYLEDIQEKEEGALSDVIGKIGTVAEHIETDRKEYKEVCDEINAAITKRDRELEAIKSKLEDKENSNKETQNELLVQENELLRKQIQEYVTKLKDCTSKEHELREELLQGQREKISLELKLEELIATNEKLVREIEVKETILSDIHETKDYKSSIKKEATQQQLLGDMEKKSGGIMKFFNRMGGKKEETLILPESEQERKLLLIRLMKEKQFSPKQMKEVSNAYAKRIDFEVIIKVIKDGFSLEQMQEVFRLLQTNKKEEEEQVTVSST